MEFIKNVKATKIELLQDGFYALVVSDEKDGKNYMEAWLMKENYGLASFIIGEETDDVESLFSYIYANADSYIEEFMEQFGDDCVR